MIITVTRGPALTDEQYTGAFVSVLRFARKVAAAPSCRLASCDISEQLIQMTSDGGPTGLPGTGVRYLIVLQTPLGRLERYIQLGPANYHRSFTYRSEEASTPWREMRKLNIGGPATPVDFLKEFPRHHKMLSFHINQWLWNHLRPEYYPYEEELIQEMFKAIGEVEPEPESELERVLLESA